LSGAQIKYKKKGCEKNMKKTIGIVLIAAICSLIFIPAASAHGILYQNGGSEGKYTEDGEGFITHIIQHTPSYPIYWHGEIVGYTQQIDTDMSQGGMTVLINGQATLPGMGI
jgi:hypothetical protein